MRTATLASLLIVALGALLAGCSGPPDTAVDEPWQAAALKVAQDIPEAGPVLSSDVRTRSDHERAVVEVIAEHRDDPSRHIRHVIAVERKDRPGRFDMHWQAVEVVDVETFTPSPAPPGSPNPRRP